METTDFEYMRALIQDASGISLSPDKVYLLETRLEPLARREGLRSLKELIERLRSSAPGPLHQEVVHAMATHETLFFRDHHPFECLRYEVLPRLIEQRKDERQLSIWCAACSSGQEPYSVAMLIDSQFPEIRAWNLRIIASDMSPKILERARSGTYTIAEVNRGLPAQLLVRYFFQREQRWVLRDEIRGMVTFEQMNLDRTWLGLPRFDLVFMRNVLIYFEVPTKRAILERVEHVLRPDGYLFLGGAETTLNLSDRFERADFERSICYRHKPFQGEGPRGR